jgi:hypothetical protein
VSPAPNQGLYGMDAPVQLRHNPTMQMLRICRRLRMICRQMHRQMVVMFGVAQTWSLLLLAGWSAELIRLNGANGAPLGRNT